MKENQNKLIIDSMPTTTQSSLLLLVFLIFHHYLLISAKHDNHQPPVLSLYRSGGTWTVLQSSIGITAMHMQLLHTNHIVIFDRTDFGASNLTITSSRCRNNSKDKALRFECTAHSVLYDVPSNTYRPLTVQTDTWCSSGSVLPNGTLVQTGGYSYGERNLRMFTPCLDPDCDWVEFTSYLTTRRWYASSQILPNGEIIIVGGRRAEDYEFFPRHLLTDTPSYELKFLTETKDPDENNLYPFLHVLPDGNLFIFANTRSILLDWTKNRVLKSFPPIPGIDKRNYPSTGSSVLLPLKVATGSGTQEAEVMVCGGAPPGACDQVRKGVFVGASNTCGRLKVNDPKPEWVMEKMPMGRIMSDMLLLPNGDVLVINGAGNGTAGWGSAINPTLNPVLYSPDEPNLNRRFQILNPSPTPRMYHSSAVVVLDGRVLVGGSNPNIRYQFTKVRYPTELSLESFSPPYLEPFWSNRRPKIVGLSETILKYQRKFTIKFNVVDLKPEKGVSVTLLAPSFTTHSFAMNQRLIVLNVDDISHNATSSYRVQVVGPPTSAIAPPGYYMLFVVHMGVPSSGEWVKIEY